MRILVVASDHVGSSMAGPGIRYLWFARELARRGHDVTLVVPFETDLTETAFLVQVENPWHSQRMTRLAKHHEAVVAQRLPVPTMLALASSRTRAIYDLYAPLTIEHAALVQHASGPTDPQFELNQLTLRVALEVGDAFVCASERQRDLWLGALVALGRVEPEQYRRDPSFRRLVGVVPFGIDPEPPVAARAVLKGVVPGIGENDKVALWGGGIWNWFDPLTVIRGVARLDRPDLKLFFLGTQHPNPGIPAMRMHAQAIALADELGLRGTTVFFNEGWVPHEKRGGYFLEADVGVSAHFDDLESHFAFRTRLLDCFWAGLPVVTTVGDTLSELVRERVVGRVVDFQDVDGYAEALAAMLDCDRSSLVADFQRLRDELAWSRVVGTLVQLLEAKQDETPQPPRRTAPISARYVLARVRYALETRGIVGTGKRLVSGPARRMRGDRAAHPPPTDSRTRRRHSS